LVKIKSPFLIDKLLEKEDYDRLLFGVGNPKKFEHDSGFGRYCVSDSSLTIIKELADKLVPTARKIFNSEKLLHTYSLFAHYEGQDPKPSLYKHKDDNACTYTIDMCVYQNEPWDLWVEDKKYTLYANQALAYYGNDQMHWREDFPSPETNYVAMIFFHYAEPDHWFFTKGKSYLDVVRGKISEADWQDKNA